MPADSWDLLVAAGSSGFIVHISRALVFHSSKQKTTGMLLQTKISPRILQGAHHATCLRPGGLCTIRTHSWPNTELHCMLTMMNHDKGIAVLAFCLLAGGCPIFKAKNTHEIICNLLGPCVPKAVSSFLAWSTRAHLYNQLINLSVLSLFCVLCAKLR